MASDVDPVRGTANPASEEIGGPPEFRTFLIADLRGYTRFTEEQGDEAAGKLAAQFAELVRDVVQAAGGVLLELRGDEALCVFVSPRQALRGAVDLQARIGAEKLRLGAGIGLDTGEAVRVEEGYRGSALNVAARLCAQAGPGQTLASETVVRLAGRVEHVRYTPIRTLRLRGLETHRSELSVWCWMPQQGRLPSFHRAGRPAFADRPCSPPSLVSRCSPSASSR